MPREPRKHSDSAPSAEDDGREELPSTINERPFPSGDLLSSQRKLRTPEAAAYLGLAESTLAKMRHYGTSPPYYKISKRAVVYDRADLDDWVAEHRRQSTSEGE